jgi:hypothetical protein
MTIIRRIKDRREMRSPGARFPEPEHQPEPEREYEYDPDWEREVASRYAADDAVQQDYEPEPQPARQPSITEVRAAATLQQCRIACARAYLRQFPPAPSEIEI